MSDTKTPEPPPTPPGRRRLLQWCAFGLGALASAAMGLPIVGYVLGIVLRPDRDQWIDLGPIDEKTYPIGQTRLRNFVLPTLTASWEGDAKKASAYVRRIDAEKFQVFAVNCAHLGCPVAWFPQAGLFMCPCHGGVYYEDGSYASGPPPRGLFQYESEIKDGRLRIKGGHLPTLHDTLRKPDPGAKA